MGRVDVEIRLPRCSSQTYGPLSEMDVLKPVRSDMKSNRVAKGWIRFDAKALETLRPKRFRNSNREIADVRPKIDKRLGRDSSDRFSVAIHAEDFICHNQ